MNDIPLIERERYSTHRKVEEMNDSPLKVLKVYVEYDGQRLIDSESLCHMNPFIGAVNVIVDAVAMEQEMREGMIDIKIKKLKAN